MKLKTFFTEHAIDPEVTEAMVNGPDDVYVERGGGLGGLGGAGTMNGLGERLAVPDPAEASRTPAREPADCLPTPAGPRGSLSADRDGG
jgi:hypothetical protein